MPRREFNVLTWCGMCPSVFENMPPETKNVYVYGMQRLFDVIQVMKSKIKSLLDTGDILSPGRSRNTTGAKTAVMNRFGALISSRSP